MRMPTVASGYAHASFPSHGRYSARAHPSTHGRVPLSKPHVSVVMSIDADPPVLDQSLRALAEQTLPVTMYEAVFVDSVHAFDRAPVFEEFLRSHSGDLNFRYYKIPKGGRAKANNFGFLHTFADIVVFLVDDFVASKSLLEAHLTFHEQHPEPHVVGIGGGFFPDDVRADPFCRWLEDSGELLGASFTRGTETFPDNYFYVGNSSVKRDFLERAGLFDEAFPFRAWDDYETGLRLAANGMKSVYLPAARATHSHRVTLASRLTQMRWAGVSAAIFEMTHVGTQAWHARCAMSPLRHRCNAFAHAAMFWLTGERRHEERYHRALLDAEFSHAYARAKAGLAV